MRHLLTIALWATTLGLPAQQNTLNIKDIHIRDPFVYADAKTKTYYLYSSMDTIVNGKRHGGVVVYSSKDLTTWSLPKRVYTASAENWSAGRVWAPELHRYKGRYYLFLRLNSDITWKAQQPNWPAYTMRCVQVMKGDKPDGTFREMSHMPTTPTDEMALDGTLYVENKQPYMVYCNEWVQRVDGTMRIAPLSKDLSHFTKSPVDLFSASAAPWSIGDKPEDGTPQSYVTDGPFIWKTSGGDLLMIWSSFMYGNYALGVARSVTGSILGPWKQQEEPLFKEDGGHGMIFKTFDNRLLLVLHSPNTSGLERATFHELIDDGHMLRIKNR